MSIISINKTNVYEYTTPESDYRPDTAYPEYFFDELSTCENGVYKAVRECLVLSGLDYENYGNKDWNPLGEYIKPGDSVLIKPNLVMDKNFNQQGGTDCLYTQPSVVAPIIDYVLIALRGTGKIIIGDAPMQECNFDNLLETSGYKQLIAFYKRKNIDIQIVDFRELTTVVRHGTYHSTIKENAKGKIVQLSDESEFYNNTENEDKVRITNYDPRILPTHHHGETQEYYISQYILDADVIINMPKPKSHRKAGATIALKNFVGANVRKEFLPHHTLGSVEEGGDEYKDKSLLRRIQSSLYDKRNILTSEKKYKKALLLTPFQKMLRYALKLTKHKYAEGSWYGNHTISRTICDLNKIIIYADKNGIMKQRKQRRMFIVADMIVSGEKEGPVNPSPKEVGVIACGDDPVQFDKAIATIMGFDIKKIPTIECCESYQGNYKFHGTSEIKIRSNEKNWEKEICAFKYNDTLKYIATDGWRGHIEIE